MRDITIGRRITEDGKYRSWKETYTYYTHTEADKLKIPYITDWRAALWARKVKVGDHVLAEVVNPEIGELEVMPVFNVALWANTWVLRVATGSFSVKAKIPLHSDKMYSPWGFSKKEGTPEKRYGMSKERFSAKMFKAAWYFARTGDHIGAYKFAYCHTKFYKGLTERQILRYANKLLTKQSFIKAFMAELSKHWEAAGLTPSDLMKNLAERITKPKEEFENVMEGTKFLMALHPDFKTNVLQLMPEITQIMPVAERPSLASTYEPAQFTELRDSNIEPGKHTSVSTDHQEEATPDDEQSTDGTSRHTPAVEEPVDDVVPGRVPDLVPLAEEKERSS